MAIALTLGKNLEYKVGGNSPGLQIRLTENMVYELIDVSAGVKTVEHDVRVGISFNLSVFMPEGITITALGGQKSGLAFTSNSIVGKITTPGDRTVELTFSDGTKTDLLIHPYIFERTLRGDA